MSLNNLETIYCQTNQKCNEKAYAPQVFYSIDTIHMDTASYLLGKNRSETLTT
jgi:hypothetical protein